MFYARGAVIAARAARSVGPTVAVSFIGARGGRRIPPAHAGGIATASERSGGDDARRVSGLCPLRTIDGMPGCATGVVGGAFWTIAGRRAALPLPELRVGEPPSSGFTRCGTGRISGSRARLLALLAAVAPYPLAARLAGLLLGVTISPMGVWRVAQRLGQAAASYSEALSRYHADSRK